MKKPNMKKFKKRQPVSVGQEELVTFKPVFPDRPLPLLVEPVLQGVDLVAWATEKKETIIAHLHKHGALLFRGFDVSGLTTFRSFVAAVSEKMLEYKERSSSRTKVGDKVYTSTEYPAQYPIFLHNENSYQQVWPMKLCLFCETPPDSDGETPLADGRRIFAAVDPKVRKAFKERGVMYLRNFNEQLGLSWQEVFQTEDRRVVEAACGEKGLEYEWRGDNSLRTRAVRKWVDKHPITGDEVWFNHATFFHHATFAKEIRTVLKRQYSPEEMPNNTYYGDGTPIEPQVIEHLQEIYLKEKISIPWERGDIALVDNMLTAHGRAPFTGPRKILLAMSDPVTADDCISQANLHPSSL